MVGKEGLKLKASYYLGTDRGFSQSQVQSGERGSQGEGGDKKEFFAGKAELRRKRKQ